MPYRKAYKPRARVVLRKRTYRKKPVAKKSLTAVVRRTRNIERNLYTWKSLREATNNTQLSLTGNIASALRACIFELSDIPLYNVANAATVSGTDPKQARQTVNPHVGYINAQVSIRCTHNHATTVRFMCFRNNGWQEPLSWTYGTAPIVATLDNLFVDFVSKADESTSPDGVRLPVQIFNNSLVSNKRDMYMNKVRYFRPLQGVGSGGEVADSLSLRNFKFKIPVNQVWKYEDRPINNSEVNNIKTGRVFFVALFGVADPANTSNAGGIIMDTRFSTVFKENV